MDHTHNVSEEKEGEFRTNIAKIVDIFAKSLYPEIDMFIRELVQNAQDSIVKRQLEEPLHVGRIEILCDARARMLVIKDDGVGMTEQEILDYLCTIGGSGTQDLRENIEEKNRESAMGLIGQFGIGILSAFVAADEITIETRSMHAPATEAIRWRVRPGENFHYTTIERDQYGTTVSLDLKSAFARMGNPVRVTEAIQKYADFIPIPIYVNGDGPVNTINPPWYDSFADAGERKKTYTAWAYNHFPDIPLEVIPVDIHDPCDVRGVLYITDRRLPISDGAGIVDIYQKRLFVCEGNRTILPPWAKFIRGVIDSPALNLTAARDSVQVDAAHAAISEALGRTIIDALIDLSRDNPDRFHRLMKWHHYFIKGMAVLHDDFFDAICDYVTFEVSLPEPGNPDAFQTMTLQDYEACQEKRDAQNKSVLYYITESAAAAQFYRLCQARGIVAINACMGFDQDFLEKYAALNKDTVVLQKIDIASEETIFTSLPDHERRMYLAMEYELHNLISDAFPDHEVVIRAERFLPPDLPAVLTQTKDTEIAARMKYIIDHPAIASETYKDLLQEFYGSQKHALEPIVLHLNASNRLIERLCGEDFEDPIVRDLLLTFYQNAFLYTRENLTPDQLELMYRRTLTTLSHVVDLREEVASLKKGQPNEDDRGSTAVEGERAPVPQE